MQQKIKRVVPIQSLLIALLFLLPSVVPLLFAWLTPLLAVAIFVLLQTVDNNSHTAILLRNSLLLSGICTILLGVEEIFLFSLTLVPLGWNFRQSAVQGKSPAGAAGAGIVVLALSWLGYWFCYAVLTGINPYTSLLTDLQTSLTQLVEAYRVSSTDFPAEMLYSMEVTSAWLRQHLPSLLPGLLASSIVLTVWLNMTLSNWLLYKLWPDKSPWQEYRCWRLPDQCVWLLIVGAGLAVIGSGYIQTTGYTVTAVMTLIYFFQGTAVFAHLLHRWKVPALWRFFLYFIVAAQGYGMLLLTVAGVADIWADFRKLAPDEQADR